MTLEQDDGPKTQDDDAPLGAAQQPRTSDEEFPR